MTHGHSVLQRNLENVECVQKAIQITALKTEGTHALIDTEITKEGQVP